MASSRTDERENRLVVVSFIYANFLGHSQDRCACPHVLVSLCCKRKATFLGTPSCGPLRRRLSRGSSKRWRTTGVVSRRSRFAPFAHHCGLPPVVTRSERLD